MSFWLGFNPFKTEAVSYRNESIDLASKSMDWFLYDNGLRLERVKLSCSCGELTGTDRNNTLGLFSVSLGKENSPHWKLATLPGHILESFCIRTSGGRFVWTYRAFVLHINFVHSNIAVNTCDYFPCHWEKNILHKHLKCLVKIS